MARSYVLTGAVLLSCGALFTAFVPAPQGSHVSAPAHTGATAALSAVALATPQAAFADEGSVWIPALSAIGAGFAIGLAAIGSGVGQGTCKEVMSHNPSVSTSCVDVCLRVTFDPILSPYVLFPVPVTSCQVLPADAALTASPVSQRLPMTCEACFCCPWLSWNP